MNSCGRLRNTTGFRINDMIYTRGIRGSTVIGGNILISTSLSLLSVQTTDIMIEDQIGRSRSWISEYHTFDLLFYEHSPTQEARHFGSSVSFSIFESTRPLNLCTYIVTASPQLQCHKVTSTAAGVDTSRFTTAGSGRRFRKVKYGFLTSQAPRTSPMDSQSRFQTPFLKDSRKACRWNP